MTQNERYSASSSRLLDYSPNPPHFSFQEIQKWKKRKKENPLFATRRPVTAQAGDDQDERRITVRSPLRWASCQRFSGQFSMGFCANSAESLHLKKEKKKKMTLFVLALHRLWKLRTRQSKKCEIAGRLATISRVWVATSRERGDAVSSARQNTPHACDWVSSATDRNKEIDDLER